jgi:hypothetical protein
VKVIDATSIPVAFVDPRWACALYALMAFLWLIPVRRIEITLTQRVS